MNPLDPTPEQPTEPVVDEQKAADAMAALTAAAGASFDQSQMNELKAKLAKLGKSNQKTTSGSEAPAEGPVAQEKPKVLTGRDMDWSEFNLDYNVAHLYPDAVYRDTPQGPKWVTMVTDFLTRTRDWGNHGKKVNVPGGNGEDKEALNLGEFLNDMVNGKERWRVAAFAPAGMQCGVCLERQIPIILPDPIRLKKSEEVEAPTDPALTAVEDAALAFMESQKEALTSDVEDETILGEVSTNDVGLRPIEAGSAEHEQLLLGLEDSGAIQARHGEGVARALATAAGETVAAPTAGVIQPEAIPGNVKAVSNANPEGKVAAAGYSAAADLLRALNDLNFRANLPQE